MAATLGSLVLTMRFVQRIENDRPEYLLQSPLFLLAGLLLTGVLLTLLFRWLRTKSAQELALLRRRFLLASLIVALGAGLLFIVLVRGLPTADANTLDQIIRQFSEGDYTALREPSYLWVYPFQLTYVLVGEGMTALFGAGSYFPYQCLNLVSILVCLYFLHRIAEELTDDARAHVLMSVLSCGLVFLFVYASFIYNDIWSLGPQMAGIWAFLRYLRDKELRHGVAAAICTGLLVFFKTNGYVLVLAMGIALAMQLMRTLPDSDDQAARRMLLRKHLAVLLLLLLFAWLPGRAVQAYYLQAAGLSSLPGGTTARAYIAMGMREGDNTYGWYNGYNAAVYRDNDYDTVATNREASEAIAASVREFVSRPKYGIKFYGYKFLSQWIDPTFVSMREYELTSRHIDGQPALLETVLYGRGSDWLHHSMNLTHLVTLLGAACYVGTAVLPAIKKRTLQRLPQGALFLMLYVLGGMTFHLLWEASSRYTIRYYLCLLPLAALGFIGLFPKKESTQEKQT